MVEIDPNRSRKLKIGFDVDGVLALFDTGYRQKLKQVSGKDGTLGVSEEPPCWNWPTECGYTQEDDNAAWKAIKADERFWVSLPPMPQARQALTILSEAYNEGHEVYFITHRMGVNPHMQTSAWLVNNGYLGFPNVLVTGNKGPIAKGLQLTHFIDDKPENCVDVAAATLKVNSLEKPTTRVFCLNARYNADYQFSDVLNITRVNSLEEFFKTLAFEETNAIA